MTNRWMNYVLTVVVLVGLVAVQFHQRPRLAEERAAFLDQEPVVTDDAPEVSSEPRDPMRLRPRESPPIDSEPDTGTQDDPDHQHDSLREPSEPVLGAAGVSASHPLATEVGLQVLEAGGHAADAAIAVAYALAVVEPFGSGVGGGGALVMAEPGGEPTSLDYREVAPASGQMPASDIGVPGFVAGMQALHDRYGTVALADLIEPAARLAEDGIEVSAYLHERLAGAAHRLPVHRLPNLFPDGRPIEPGERLLQPEHAATLRLIQDGGADAFYSGTPAHAITEAVPDLTADDLSGYEVAEVDVVSGRFAGYDVVGAGLPTSAVSVVQLLQVAERLELDQLERDGVDARHRLAQAWRQVLGDRTAYVADPRVEEVDLDALLGRSRADELSGRIDDDGFSPVEVEEELVTSTETDTTHVVVVDGNGTMISMTNTLSNFFGSGLAVEGFFLNDQLKNFSGEPDSINVAAAGKRPRSFVSPLLLLDDGRPVVGIGSPGGRRIPFAVAQVLVRWALWGEDLQAATAAPRFHLEGEELQLEEDVHRDERVAYERLGYNVTTDVPTTEYFGGIQALEAEYDTQQVHGVADERRTGTWASLDMSTGEAPPGARPNGPMALGR